MTAAERTKPNPCNAENSKNVIDLEANHMENPGAAQGFQQIGKPMLRAYTLETAFVYSQAVDPRSLDDIMTCALGRSEAVVQLLLSDLADNSEFTHTPKTLTNALLLLQGQIEQMQTVMRNYRKGAAA